MKLNPYLNFNGNAEEAFRFYQSVFGGELTLMKMGDAPGAENLSESERSMAMHVSIPIGADQYLMASDCTGQAGVQLQFGNNNYIAVSPDSRDEADRIFNGLSPGGMVEMPMADIFWGDYFGSFKDKFGVYWMIIFENSKVATKMSENDVPVFESKSLL
jgi:PhnB protein